MALETLDRLRVRLRQILGVDIGNLDDPMADELLNQSYFELDNKFPFREKDAVLRFTTQASQPKYQFNAGFESVIVASIVDPVSEQRSPLTRITKVDYESKLNEDAEYEAMPCEYTRDGDTIILYPTPDAEYAVNIRYQKQLAELVDDADSADLPRVWREILLYGAVWRGFLEFGDMNRSDHFKNHQVALIRSTVPVESKEEFDTHTGGVVVLGRRGYR